MVLEVIARTLYKMFVFKKGSLTVMSVFLSFTATQIFKKIFDGTDTRNLIIPVLVFCVGFILYFFFLCADLHTGLQVAKYKSYVRNKGQSVPYVKSYKLYRTLWKLLGVVLISVLMLVTVIMIEIIHVDFLYKVFLIIQSATWFLACGFEAHSIGENHLKRYGYKPKIFVFFDKILNMFERKIISKVDESFTNLNDK